MNRLLPTAVLGIFLAVGTVAPPVAAQLSDATAQKQFDEGLRLEQEGKWGRALKAFEQAAEIEPSAQVSFHMAKAKEQLGRLTEALGDARSAEEAAQKAGARNLAEIEELREWLEARTPQLTIKLGEGTEGATISIGGKTLEDLSTPIRIDPGSHRIEVKLPDGARFEESVSIGAGEQDEIELIRPDDLQTPPPVASPPPGPSSPPADDGPTDVTVDESSPVLPFIIGGAGVASLIASGVFLVLRNQAVADLDDECRGDVCPQSLEGKHNDAKTFTTVSRVTLGVGVVGVGVATVLLLTGGGSSKASTGKPTVAVALEAARGRTGVNVSGTF